MNRKIPISMILVMVSLVGLIVISIVLWNGGERGALSMDSIYGDPSILDQIQVETTSTRDNRFLLTQTITFGNQNPVTTKLTKRFHEPIKQESFPYRLQMNTWTDELSRQFDLLRNSKESRVIKINTKFPYVKPRISFFGWSMYLGDEDASPYLKIQIPDNAMIIIDGNDELKNRFIFPQYSNICESVTIDNRMYFTYYNWELNVPFDAQDYGCAPIEYEGITGLFSIPVDENGLPVEEVTPVSSWVVLTRLVTKLLELEVGSDKETVVLKMAAVFDQSQIALVVSEENHLVLYLYDIKSNTLLDKFIIGEWNPDEEINIKKVNLVSKDSLISIQILYQTKEANLSQDVYVIDYSATGGSEVISWENVVNNFSEQTHQDLYYMEPTDMIYDQGRLYYVIGAPKDAWYDTQYFYILALSEGSIDYFGKIETDFSEDQTIGRINSDTKLDDAKNRNYNNLRFVSP